MTLVKTVKPKYAYELSKIIELYTQLREKQKDRENQGRQVSTKCYQSRDIDGCSQNPWFLQSNLYYLW